MGSQIEGDRKTLLTGSQVLAVELVGFFYCTESSILLNSNNKKKRGKAS